MQTVPADGDGHPLMFVLISKGIGIYTKGCKVSETVLRLVARQTSLVARPISVQFAVQVVPRQDPPPPPGSATDIAIIIDDLFDAANKEKIGHDEIVCIAVSADGSQCTGT